VGSARSFPLGAMVTLAALEGDPHGLLAELRAKEPVSWLPVLGGWLVTRRDLAQQVMRDPETYTVDDSRFSTAQVLGPSMLSLDGAEHARHREPFVAPFRRAEVTARHAPAIARHARRLVEGIAGRGAAELRRELAGPLAVAVIGESLGFAGLDAATVMCWYDAIVSAVQAITAGEEPPAAASEAVSELREHVTATIVEMPGSVVARAAATGLSFEEVASDVAVTMFGAIETTEGMIANALLHLLERADQLELVCQDRSLVSAAVEESLRFEPAAAVVDRYATRPVRLAGAGIAAGELVRVSLSAANRDPEVFDDPDRFDLRRVNSLLHLAFAAGQHGCIGAALARCEAVAAIEAVLGLAGLRLDDERPSAVRGLVFRKPPALHVCFDGWRLDGWGGHHGDSARSAGD
jgi:cytochrome P450